MHRSPQKIVIVHVIHNICLAGTELNVIKQVNALDRRRFNPVIVSITDRPGTAEQLISEDVRVYKVRKNSGFQREIIFELASLYRKIKPHIVYSHNWTTFLYSTISAKLARVPIILHGEHGRDQAAYKENWKRSLACRFLSRWCNRITVVSKDIIEILENIWKVPGWKIEYMPNGIDLDRFKPIANKIALRQKLKLPPSKLLIGAIVGKVRPVKDLPTLLRAFRVVIETLPNAELLLVGDGLNNPTIQDLIDELNLRNCVKLWKHRPAVQEVFAALDIYVNSSLYEGMSNTILEAQACGIPLVATAVGGTPTIVRDGWNGLLVPAADINQMADAILRIACDERVQKKLSKNARHYVEEHHDFKYVIKRFEALYEKHFRAKSEGRLTIKPKMIRAIGEASLWRERMPIIKIKKNAPIFIINYHRILPDLKSNEYIFSPMVTAESVFERQIKFFRKKCHVISANEALELISNPQLPRFERSILLTFDDGYKDFFTYALPILEEFCTPALIFMIVKKIGDKRGVWFDRMSSILYNEKDWLHNGPLPIPDELKPEFEMVTTSASARNKKLAVRQFIHKMTLMPQSEVELLVNQFEERFGYNIHQKNQLIPEFLNWEEIKMLSRLERITIGSHGLKHQRLDLIPDAEVEKEIYNSKHELETRLQQQIEYFSYPWGAYKDKTIEIVRRAGYRAAFALGDLPCGKPKNLYEIQRIDSGRLLLDGKFDESYMMGMFSQLTYRLREMKSYMYF